MLEGCNIILSIRCIPERSEMNIEYQLQIDAIKGERIFYKEYGDLILVSNGHTGVYLKERELKLDKSKMIQIREKPNAISLCLEDLFKDRTAAIETRVAHKLPGSGYAIKLYSKESGEYCFVNEKYLKMFKGYNSLYIKSKRDPVLVYKYGVPYGIILPVFISEAALQESEGKE